MEEKIIYKVLAQKDDYTIICQTEPLIFEEAKQAATHLISREKDLRPFVLVPLTTKERWEYGTINFCPRCGTSLRDEKLERYADVYCHRCYASMEIQIYDVGNDDE